MSKYRRAQLFFQKAAFGQGTLTRLTVSALAGLLGERLVVAIGRTTWEQRGNVVNLLAHWGLGDDKDAVRCIRMLAN